ncbi:unnamed protein product, partial [Ectocarpus fasciculatus]
MYTYIPACHRHVEAASWRVCTRNGRRDTHDRLKTACKMYTYTAVHRWLLTQGSMHFARRTFPVFSLSLHAAPGCARIRESSNSGEGRSPCLPSSLPPFNRRRRGGPQQVPQNREHLSWLTSSRGTRSTITNVKEC